MASVEPIPHTDRVCGASPTGSRPSAGRSWWRALPGTARASPPRFPLAARRSEPTRRMSTDLRPGLVRALEGVAFVHGRNRREVEIALAVHREGEGRAVARFRGIE